MLEAFVWMFKTEDFKKQFLYLFSIGLLLYLLAFSLIIIKIPEPLSFYTNILAYILSVMPTLYVLGYFFNLSYQIINREIDLDANNIYDGKIKEVFKITLPEVNLLSNIWRGIASAFAIFLLLLPFIFIIKSGLDSGVLQSISPVAGTLIILFLAAFLPALVWNYAKRHSIISVWNIRIAIYLIGNYAFKYFINVLTIALLVVLNYFIDALLASFLPTTPAAMANLNAGTVIIAVIISLIFGIKYLYFTFVNAYLLGTIAPVSEA